jgi:hypothetical protein
MLTARRCTRSGRVSHRGDAIVGGARHSAGRVGPWPRGRRLTPGRAGRRLCWIAGLTVAVVAYGGRDAQAVPVPLPNPLGPIGEALGAGGAGIAVKAFDAIIAHLFAPVARFVNVELLGWRVMVPNFSGGNVRELETTVCAMGAMEIGGQVRSTADDLVRAAEDAGLDAPDLAGIFTEEMLAQPTTRRPAPPG